MNSQLTMRVADFPELEFFKGRTLIHTDGTTLLGADDKAGVAEIMTAAEYLLAHPEIKHGKIRIGFTPDEAVGRGGYDNVTVIVVDVTGLAEQHRPKLTRQSRATALMLAPLLVAG